MPHWADNCNIGHFKGLTEKSLTLCEKIRYPIQYSKMFKDFDRAETR